ncbi:unnamed protein product, partial [Prorocentrum cordatum]
SARASSCAPPWGGCSRTQPRTTPGGRCSRRCGGGVGRSPGRAPTWRRACGWCGSAGRPRSSARPCAAVPRAWASRNAPWLRRPSRP